MIFIYTINCPITNDIKYVGKTKNKLESRLKQHIYQSKKNAKNKIQCWIKTLLNNNLLPIITILDYADTNKNANILESMYIQLFKSWNIDLKNMTNGGDGQCNMPLETRKKISNSRKGKCKGNKNGFFGKKHNQETIEKMKNKVFSIETRNKISQKIKDLNKLNPERRIGKNNPNCKSISCYDLDGNFIKSYDFIKEVLIDGHIPSAVSKVLNGKFNKHHNLLWKYN